MNSGTKDQQQIYTIHMQNGEIVQASISDMHHIGQRGYAEVGGHEIEVYLSTGIWFERAPLLPLLPETRR